MAESAVRLTAPRKRPPLAWVVFGPVEVDAPVDWSRWYVSDEDDVGESGEQLTTNRLLQDVGEQWARERGVRRRVSGVSCRGRVVTTVRS
jgi:hypothetical protein